MPIAALELRHRQRARAEGRLRNARAADPRNLPLRDTAQYQILLEIIQIAFATAGPPKRPPSLQQPETTHQLN
jgi:hypothetical protein